MFAQQCLCSPCSFSGGFPSWMQSPSGLSPVPSLPPQGPHAQGPDVLWLQGILHLSPRWCCHSKLRCPVAPGRRTRWLRGCCHQRSAPHEATCGLLLTLFSAASTQAWTASTEARCLGCCAGSLLGILCSFGARPVLLLSAQLGESVSGVPGPSWALRRGNCRGVTSLWLARSDAVLGPRGRGGCRSSQKPPW